MHISVSEVPFPFGPFVKYEHNPILSPQGDSWESKDLFNPAAVVKDGKVYLLYRAEDGTGAGQWNGTSRLGLAISEDGLHFERHPHPVLIPTESYEQPGGCEDPRITQIDDTYYLTYTAFDGYSATLCLATSKDLFVWEKHGVLFPDWRGGSERVWSKSGAILAEPIDGRYIMYFGDTNIWMAYSDDLIHWTPVKEPVFTPSPDPNAFDSALIEPGPQPLVTPEGILLMYNAAQRITDPSNPACGRLRYAAGQVLLSKEDPHQVLKRMTVPFFTPGTRDEIVGQVDNVVFVEGLVDFKGAHYLYYGMADSKIGVAVCRR
ncbi:glycosylase [Alicyclobacillus contaminans]|uniref:glycoside hydrolase family 130 protein n=1 Tax=Alicyclobacillus contaminans TaxID=392016 RepID=UPI000414965C|nr:glycoside hydrolase family 130 protein [Alicyclobacillus contaminans]GMA50834.1 glycosylase [Alicyclobacillus contaminans]